MKKRILFIGLCLTVAFALLGGVLPALEVSALRPAPAITGRIEPICPDQESYVPQSAYSVLSDTDQQAIDTAAATLRQAMVNREQSVSISLIVSQQDAETLWYQVWDLAKAHTGSPKEGDYLARQWGSCSGGYRYSISSGTMNLTLEYEISYYTDAAQEAELDLAISALLEELDLWDATDYEKICGIYDFICQNITYDYDHLNDGSYKLKFTAYAALMDRTAVCQGYALLFYRLSLELGVDARLITGTGNGGGHAWNIVKFGDLYYDLDATWDASWYEAGLEYHWFLLGSEHFSSHLSDEDFTTAEFMAAYPISEDDYEVPITNVIASGTCGDDLTWTLDDAGTLTVSGTGGMYFSYDSVPWRSYWSSIKNVVLEQGVTNIGSYAFYNCDNLTSVTIPDSATNIGSHSFFSCENLAYIIIPNNVTGIGNYAFYDCNSLTNASIGYGTENIGSFAFSSCSNLTGIFVDENNQYYSSDASGVLFDKYKYTLILAPGAIAGDYVVPDCVTSIDRSAFADCASLVSVLIPDSVTSIGLAAFRDCGSLTSISLPSGLTIIEADTFHSCSSLTSIVIPDGVTSIGSCAFENCTSLSCIVIPASLTGIEVYATHGCRSLWHVLYKGTEEEWAAISKSSFNYLSNATHFNCTGDEIIDLENKICSVCQQNCTHNWDQGQTLSEPTCTEAGDVLYTCTWCALTEHRAIAPTGHSYSSVVTAPTCTEQGYTTHTCHCGNSYVDSYVDSLGHNYGEWYTVTAPTCTEEGLEQHNCTRCEHSETRVIAVSGHSYTSVVTDPTCTEQGYTTHTCHCGDSYVDSYVDALDHDYGDWFVVTDASCTEDGQERHNCSRCDHHETRVVQATGHNYVDSIFEPTCTEQGFTAHICSNCRDTYTDSYTDALGHDYDDWDVVMEATCTEDGLQQRVCARCSCFEIQTIAAPGHSHESVVTDPTCTEQGYTTHTCHCGDSYVDSYTDPLGHHYVDGVCARCGKADPDAVATGDVNGDGQINYLDAMLIAQFYVGALDSFPAATTKEIPAVAVKIRPRTKCLLRLCHSKI